MDYLFFCDCIKQQLKSRLAHEGPCPSFSPFLDFTLLFVDSSFIVGVAEEDCVCACNGSCRVYSTTISGTFNYADHYSG